MTLLNVYRNPRYMIDHAYRNENADVTSLAADPPISRVIDGQNQRAAEISQLTAADIDIDRGTPFLVSFANLLVPLDRIIIAGTNTLKNRELYELFYSEDDISYFERPLLDGSTVGFAGFPGVMDFEVARKANATGANRFERVSIGASAVANHQIGEVYASRALTTSSGLVFSWSDEDVPNNVVSETFAGNTYVLERGDPRRVWTMRYQGIDDTDMRLLDEIRRTVGLQTHPFWFDPPASGNVEDRSTWNVGDFANWSASAGVTLTELPIGSQSGGPAIRAINTAASFVAVDYLLPATEDLSGKLLQFDMKQSPAAWATTPQEIRSRIVSTGTFPRSEYGIGDLWGQMDATNDGDWQRFQIDFALSQPTGVGQLDIDSVGRIGFTLDNGVANDGIEIANTALIEKSEQVAYVEMLDFQKRQVSSSPKFRLAFDVDVTVREVLS